MVSYENHGNTWVKEKGKLKIKMDEGRCYSQNSRQDQREGRGSTQNEKKWSRLPLMEDKACQCLHGHPQSRDLGDLTQCSPLNRKGLTPLW